MLNLAGTYTSPSKSNNHLSEERAEPRIHDLGRALGPTTDGWKQTLSSSHASLLLVLPGKGRNRHSGLEGQQEAGRLWAVGMRAATQPEVL